ncbi:MAG: hypothetical protein ACD_8C00081G0002 [uncultured bacterium]|nr:MAG: hypothetical protein ACD_8C00081G0002 [uncultured bacterium]
MVLIIFGSIILQIIHGQLLLRHPQLFLVVLLLVVVVWFLMEKVIFMQRGEITLLIFGSIQFMITMHPLGFLNHPRLI